MTPSSDFPAFRFIGAPIEVEHDRPPSMEKKPGAPGSFTWEGRSYRVLEGLSEWHDYHMRGRTASFYVKEQGSFRAKQANRRGSWGGGARLLPRSHRVW